MKRNLMERRVGTRQKVAKPVCLIAGPLTVDFVAGGLRAIRYEGHEVLRAIAYIVRDQSWGTYDPDIANAWLKRARTHSPLTIKRAAFLLTPSRPSATRRTLPATLAVI